MKRMVPSTNKAYILAGSTLFLFGTCLAIFLCLYFFLEIHIVAYRLVVIFLSLIFISNLGAKLLFNYFEKKT